MFYLDIIYSESANKYYVGYSVDPWRRLIEHNNKPFTSFTSKFRPWTLKAVFQCGTTEKEAMRMEKFIKNQKSRRLLEQLCDPSFIPTEFLALPGLTRDGYPALGGTRLRDFMEMKLFF